MRRGVVRGGLQSPVATINQLEPQVHEEIKDRYKEGTEIAKQGGVKGWDCPENLAQSQESPPRTAPVSDVPRLLLWLILQSYCAVVSNNLKRGTAQADDG